MIKVRIAAWLLKRGGNAVEFAVRRIFSATKGKGTTVLATPHIKKALAKYRAMRIAETDTITITVAAVIAQRRGTVLVNTEAEDVE